MTERPKIAITHEMDRAIVNMIAKKVKPGEIDQTKKPNQKH